VTAQAPLVAEAQAAQPIATSPRWRRRVRARGAPSKPREAELAELSQEHLDDLRVVFDLKLP
jgi:hypothetical protein